MAEVTVTIAGRQYRMACDDGQEDHLNELGEMIDQKIADMRASFGEIGDMRLTVMAAIVVADELSEAKRKAAGFEEQLERLRNADDNELALCEQDSAEAAEMIGGLAERLEVLAADLRTRLRAGAGAKAGEALD